MLNYSLQYKILNYFTPIIVSLHCCRPTHVFKPKIPDFFQCNYVLVYSHILVKLLYAQLEYLDIHVSVHRDIITKTTNKIQLCRLIYYSLSGLHVSGDVFSYNQEH